MLLTLDLRLYSGNLLRFCVKTGSGSEMVEVTGSNERSLMLRLLKMISGLLSQGLHLKARKENNQSLDIYLTFSTSSLFEFENA